jgi:GntR family transcriptional regulator
MSTSASSYHVVLNDLRAAILRGDYPPGSTLPKIKDLAARYGLSTPTIRTATRHLQAEGLVAPIRGHGIYVRDRTPVRLPIGRYRPSDPRGRWEQALHDQGLVGHSELTDVREVPAPEDVARELQIDPSTSVIRRDHHLYLSRHVAQLHTSWLPAALVRDTALTEPATVPGGLYRGLTGLGHTLASSGETVTSRMPTRDEAEVLKLGLGTPVLDIRRTTRSHDGTPIVHTHAVADGTRISLTYHQDFD